MQASTSLITVASTLLAFTVTFAIAQNRCALQSSCDSCTAQSECGWCSETGMCEGGNATSSWSGDCHGANWSWIYDQCPVTPATTPVPIWTQPVFHDCSNYDYSCYLCVERQCGYCYATQLCEDGNSTSSADGTCSGANWTMLPTTCIPPAAKP